MNTFALLGIFLLGAFSAIILSMTFHLYQNESTRLEELIASRRRMYERSEKMVSIPDESQLSVVPQAEVVLDFTKEAHPYFSFESDSGEVFISFLQL